MIVGVKSSQRVTVMKVSIFLAFIYVLEPCFSRSNEQNLCTNYVKKIE